MALEGPSYAILPQEDSPLGKVGDRVEFLRRRPRHESLDEAEEHTYMFMGETGSIGSLGQIWRRHRLVILLCFGWGLLITSVVILNLYLTLIALFATDLLFRGYDDAPEHPTPIPCHSHNDYWRAKPVYSALDVGCIGIEADLWLLRDELYVSHDWASIKQDNTFTNMYIKPLVEILDRRNAQVVGYGTPPNGVYVSAPEQTLILLIDIKSDSEQLWPLVLQQLEPLRRRGWLSYVENGSVRYGPITVVASGNSRFDVVTRNSTYRDVFYDAPVDRLSEEAYDSSNSLYASAHFRKVLGLSFTGRLSDWQLEKIRSQVRESHEKNLMVRYWSQPSWPTVVRNRIWKSLLEEGVDIINVDDVEGFREAWDSGWLRRRIN